MASKKNSLLEYVNSPFLNGGGYSRPSLKSDEAPSPIPALGSGFNQMLYGQSSTPLTPVFSTYEDLPRAPSLGYGGSQLASLKHSYDNLQFNAGPMSALSVLQDQEESSNLGSFYHGSSSGSPIQKLVETGEFSKMNYAFSNNNEFLSLLHRLVKGRLTIHVFDLYSKAVEDGLTFDLNVYNTVLSIMANDENAHASSSAIQNLLGVYMDMLKVGLEPDVLSYESIILALCRRADYVTKEIESLESRVKYSAKCVTQDLQSKITSLRSEIPLETAVFIYTSSIMSAENISYSSSFYNQMLSTVCTYGADVQLTFLMENLKPNVFSSESSSTLVPVLIQCFGKLGKLEKCIQLMHRFNLANRMFTHPNASVGVLKALLEAYFYNDCISDAVSVMETILTGHGVGLIPVELSMLFLSHLAKKGCYKEAFSWLKALERSPKFVVTANVLDDILSSACSNGDVDFAIVFVRTYSLAKFSGQYVALLRYLELLAVEQRVDVLRLHAPPLIRSVSSWTNHTFANVYKALISSGHLAVALRLLRKHVDPRDRFDTNQFPAYLFMLIPCVFNDFWEALDSNLRKDPNVCLHLLSILQTQRGFLLLSFNVHLLRTVIYHLAKQSDYSSFLSPRMFAFCLEYTAFIVVQTEGSDGLVNDLLLLLECFMKHGRPLPFTNVYIVFRSLSYLEKDDDFVRKVRAAVFTEVSTGFSTDSGGGRILADISQVCHDVDGLDVVNQEANSAILKMLTNSPFQQVDINMLLFNFGKLMETGTYLHPEVYPLLISVLSKNKRFDAVQKVFQHTKALFRLMKSSSLEKANWFLALVLDSMVLASSIARDFHMSNTYRQEMRELGYVPRASTFAHLINNSSRKGDTDDASTALAIFEETKVSNVRPSVFLYNAVLSKLGRARRTVECMKLFHEMKDRGLVPTSVTYGTVINAACRVGDERLAENMFIEMEKQPNYQPRVAPYNTMIQFEVQTMFSRAKALQYHNRLCIAGIKPSSHTFKLLMDAYGTLKPIDIASVGTIFELMRRLNTPVLAMHYSACIHIQGIVLSDIKAATECYNEALEKARAKELVLDANFFQSQIESLVENEQLDNAISVVKDMEKFGVKLNAYIVNALIKGFSKVGNLERARFYFDLLETRGTTRKEPSTYENMVRAYLYFDKAMEALEVVSQLKRKRYPGPVVNKISSLVDTYLQHNNPLFTKHSPSHKKQGSPNSAAAGVFHGKERKPNTPRQQYNRIRE
ncbi:PPR repeat protein [Schizosaccharomyces japonicus yFS275]|uniref:PPR repeat protein n=1 Tax=Schizosaccharomyces japonicus (strain yFS275 / FY16936) TaxID=402676 RepID=B6JZ58_SCHJY|nr:PPR repeat protein [Schizosaccharomyces japonicus yFS275]EEB06826.1 PPR repeat protein [Schizosaccharomyces japonicus yFS275]